MITLGIDIGAKNIKIVILKDNKIIAKTNVAAGFEVTKSAREALNKVMKEAGISKNDIDKTIATGAGDKLAPFYDDTKSIVGCDSLGAVFLHPATRTVIDVGAEEGRGMRCDETGKILDFEVNEKCAAGAGAFTEAMSRALEVSLEEFGPLSLKATEEIPMNAQCTVFAESEVVTMVHNNISKANMAKAVHDAMSSRISSMVRKIGFNKDVTLVGGVAKNVGFVDSLNRDLELEVFVPKDPEYVGALGAALAAAGWKGGT
ncbi:MAG: CoA activase [Candidatus Thermoplasmatota archaeon]|nr:CoA activase [Candidatus Thermoplasmatota archaeon]MBU1940442.1 CoA activase [Candidatus Thermoplasmatota archaeon]